MRISDWSSDVCSSDLLGKDGSALERLAEVDRAMIDKTGTLTLGRPVATNLDEADASVRALLLALARASRHPLSEALTRDLTAAGATPVTVEAIRETPGFGVEALWNGRKVTLGDRKSTRLNSSH